MSDLVERLQAAAVAAIADEALELERDPRRLRGVVLDFKLRQNPAGPPSVAEATCYVERRVQLPRGEIS